MSISKDEKSREARAQKLYAASKPRNLTPARTHVNSVMTELYTGGNNQLARPEGGNAFLIQSKGYV